MKVLKPLEVTDGEFDSDFCIVEFESFVEILGTTWTLNGIVRCPEADLDGVGLADVIAEIELKGLEPG